MKYALISAIVAATTSMVAAAPAPPMHWWATGPGPVRLPGEPYKAPRASPRHEVLDAAAASATALPNFPLSPAPLSPAAMPLDLNREWVPTDKRDESADDAMVHEAVHDLSGKLAGAIKQVKPDTAAAAADAITIGVIETDKLLTSHGKSMHPAAVAPRDHDDDAEVHEASHRLSAKLGAVVDTVKPHTVAGDVLNISAIEAGKYKYVVGDFVKIGVTEAGKELDKLPPVPSPSSSYDLGRRLDHAVAPDNAAAAGPAPTEKH